MAPPPLSSRTRFVLAALLATLPLVALVTYAAVDRYDADRARAVQRASVRSQLYATLVAQSGRPASAATLDSVLTLAPLTKGTVISLLDGAGSVVASSGTSRELGPGDARVAAALHQAGTLHARGLDGTDRVWGFTPIRGSAATLAYGVTGSDVYGAARTALWRDLGLALAAALAAVAAAFLLAGRATAPIRRLAAHFGGADSVPDIGAIELGIHRLDATIEEGEVELASKGAALEQLNVELRAHELEVARLGTIVESSGDAIVGMTLDGTITSWNSGARKLFGYTPAEIVGHDVSALAPPGEDAELRTIIEQIRAGTASERVVLRRLTKDGEPQYVSLTVSPIHGADGGVDGASMIARDATRRVLAEEKIQRLNEELEERVRVRTVQLEDANRELEAFSYSVSHDLRAPLRAIDGFSRIVIEDYAEVLDAEGRRYLELVGKSTREMGRLIDGLLAFSRLGQQQLDKRLLDVEGLVRDVVASLVGENGGPEVSVGALPAARADSTLLRQVFANLISNAIKYSRERDEPRVEVFAEESGRSPVYVVRDNGVGFDMRYVDKLFTPFQRLHRAETYEGTGIGLALVARIVTRHGGRIWADAKLDEGATFSFTLGGGDV